jgi:hypothetical protein
MRIRGLAHGLQTFFGAQATPVRQTKRLNFDAVAMKKYQLSDFIFRGMKPTQS